MRPEIRRLVEQLMPDADDAVVVDFESYYDDDCSVATLGNWAYTHHKRWNAYLVTIFGRGVEYVGHPKDAPWREIGGRPWVAHNAGFDAACFDRLVEQGVVPADVAPSRWIDSADLAAFLGFPRNLEGASNHAFDIALSKDVRNVTMKGKDWHEFTDVEKKLVLDYAADDAIAWCLWQKFRLEWPADEQEYSQHTFMSARRGVAVNVERLERDIDILKKMLWVAEQEVPWVDEVDEKGKAYTVRSTKARDLACEKAGVPIPTTTSLKEEAFQEWLDEYGDQVPAMIAVVHYRKIDRALKVYQSLLTRLRPDGRADVGLKYYGADKTGRWAGGSGFNLQNLIKQPVYCDAEWRWLDTKEGAAHACDIRACIVAGKGKKLLIPDLSQIEPRCLNWIVGNAVFLDLCAKGVSPYEAAAIADGVWQGLEKLKKADPSLYALYKARVLALGYGAGWRKFISMAFQYVGPEVFKRIFEAEVTPEAEAKFLELLEYLKKKRADKEAARDLKVWPTLSREEKNIWVNSWLEVSDWRQRNPLIASRNPEAPGIWHQLDSAFKDSVRDGYFELELPSGRKLRYFDVSASGGWTAKRTRGGRPERMYGGKLTENMVQAVARDVFAAAILRLEAAGFPVVFHVHDEAIIEADENASLEEVLAILKQVPAWATGLPVDSEGAESTHYLK